MVTIRPILNDDLPVLSPLWLEQMSLLSQVDSRHTLPPNALEAWLEGMAVLLADVRTLAFTAQSEDERLVAFVVAWEPPIGLMSGAGSRIGLIGDLVIDMHRYHGGVARQLVNAVRAGFAERGVTRLTAISPSRHVIGQTFWRSMGVAEWLDVFSLR